MALVQTRRDLAKQETRTALADAALELLRERGTAALSADEIASRAGVSRRTFFNYFGTTEAVLAAPCLDFMEAVVAEVRSRPHDERLMDSIVAGMTAPTPQVMGRFAAVVRGCQGDAGGERVEREVWDHATVEVGRALRDRFAGCEGMRADVLAAAVMATGRVGVDAWVASLTEQDVDPAGAADPAARVDPQGLRTCLITAFGYLTDGFPDVAPTAPRA